jgi:putative alpha-1,2-mannosidase
MPKTNLCITAHKMVQLLPGYKFAGTGFWDTFRALYPFLNLVYPSINKEMQEGLINDYKEGGWLPEWSSPGYSDVMVGNNSASVVSDAYLKGGRGYDINTLYEALTHGANNDGPALQAAMVWNTITRLGMYLMM